MTRPAAGRAGILARRGALLLRPAIALAGLLGIPSSHAGEEDIAYFEKIYKTEITGVGPIEEYPDPALFYAAIAQKLGIREKALAAAKANGWKEDPEKVQNAVVNRLSATARWQIIIGQMKLDRKNNEVDRESIEVAMLELGDRGRLTPSSYQTGRRKRERSGRSSVTMGSWR